MILAAVRALSVKETNLRTRLPNCRLLNHHTLSSRSSRVLNSTKFCTDGAQLISKNQLKRNQASVPCFPPLIYLQHEHNRDRFYRPGVLNEHLYLTPNYLNVRSFHSVGKFTLYNDTKSKVEQSVNKLKEDAEVKVESKAAVRVVEPKKKTILQRVWDEVLHYYHGFRLLFIDFMISTKLVRRLLHGETLSRREHKQLVRTVSDVFRLVPFSVFIIVPFMELLLPVFIKFFPNMLPSTFQTRSDAELKQKKTLKVKLEMAKFLQDTLDEMTLQAPGDKKSQNARDFVEFLNRIRESGAQASNEEILRFSKLFEDEITLDNLSREQLMAVCRLVEVQTIGTNNFLRFQLRMKLRNLKADDKIIQKEGINSLNEDELMQACRNRGMRATGLSQEALRTNLNQWLELSLNEKIPPSLLLLSRALFLPENLPPTDILKATLLTLPESAAVHTKAKIGEMEGKVDHKTKIEVIREEEAKIKREKEEKIKRDKEEALVLQDAATEVLEPKTIELGSGTPVLADRAKVMVDKATIVKDRAPTDAPPVQKPAESIEVTTKDIAAIEDALEDVAQSKHKLMIEKEELQDLKEEIADYKEDIEELSKLSGTKLKERKVASRLFKNVNKLITSMDKTIDDLELKKGKIDVIKKEKVEPGVIKKYEQEMVSIEELIHAMRKLQKTPDDARQQKIQTILAQMDDDHDGSVKVDDVVKVLELIGSEDIKISPKQMREIIDMLEKEENVELLEKQELTNKTLASSSVKKEQQPHPQEKNAAAEPKSNVPQSKHNLMADKEDLKGKNAGYEEDIEKLNKLSGTKLKQTKPEEKAAARAAEPKSNGEKKV